MSELAWPAVALIAVFLAYRVAIRRTLDTKTTDQIRTRLDAVEGQVAGALTLVGDADHGLEDLANRVLVVEQRTDPAGLAQRMRAPAGGHIR